MLLLEAGRVGEIASRKWQTYLPNNFHTVMTSILARVPLQQPPQIPGVNTLSNLASRLKDIQEIGRNQISAVVDTVQQMHPYAAISVLIHLYIESPVVEGGP